MRLDGADANEELQSTNEELETTNEELQSTNDELEAMNDEQVSRSEELDKANMFLEGILGSLGLGVVVVDRDERVQVWNANSEELWGLRAHEVEGELLASLDMGFPVERARERLRALFADGREREETLPAITHAEGGRSRAASSCSRCAGPTARSTARCCSWR